MKNPGLSFGGKLGKIEVMSKKERYFYSLLLFIGFFLTGFFGLWWFQPVHIPQNFYGFAHIFDFALFTILSYVVWYEIVNELFSWLVALTMKKPLIMEPEKSLKVAFLTAFVPGIEPYDILENTLRAIVAVRYPHDTWLLDEGNDAIVKKICKKYRVHHYSRKGIEKYNLPQGPYKAKTKGGNYNSWFDVHGKKYEFVTQVDVDFAPNRDFLHKTLGYFKYPEVAFVGSPQIYGNTNDSWIVKGAAQQAYGFYGSMQKGFFGIDMQLFIGANHVIRTKAHNSIDGYQGHIVEDHITGMKFYTKKWKSVYVPEILAIGEGPSTWDAYFSQQMRWAYGLIHILFTQSPRLFPKMGIKHVMSYFLLQQYYFYGLAQILGIGLISIFFFFGIQTTNMNFIELLLFYPTVLIWQQVIFLWLQRFNIDPKKESGLMLWAKYLNYAVWPIYFLGFVGVAIGKRLTYKVTPKGSSQKKNVSLTLFIPHFILGSLTLIDILLAIFTKRFSPPLVFWSVINTLAMYSFIGIVIFTQVFESFQRHVNTIKKFLTLPLDFPKIVISYLAELIF